MTRGAPIPDAVTLHVLFRFLKRGGRKEMRMPEGAIQPRKTDNALVKARGALLDEGLRVATIWECALRKPEQVSVAADRLAKWLVAVGDTLELGENEASAHVREGEDAGSSR